MKTLKKDASFLGSLLLGSGIFLFLLFIFMVNRYHFTAHLNADMASDVLLAQLMWDKKEIVPQSWYAASELRLIQTPNLSALFYGLSGDVVLAAGWSCCGMTLGILFSLWYFMNGIGVEGIYKLLMVFLCLMLPCSFISLELLYLYASYYAAHVVILFLTLGFYQRCLRYQKINWPMALLLSALALILGLQGVRGLLVIYGPLLAVELLRQLVLPRGAGGGKPNRQTGLMIFLFFALNYVGTRCSLSVGQSFGRNIRKGFGKLFTVVLPDIGKTIGFPYTGWAGKIILAVFCMVSALYLILLLKKLFQKREAETFAWSYLVLAASPLLTALMVAFTTVESTERYYFVFFFMIAMSLVFTLRECHQRQNQKRKTAILVGILLLSVIHSRSVYLPVLTSREPPQSEWLSVARYLTEEEYKIAYASFENANTISVLSGARVIAAPVADMATMTICKWMSSTDWYVPNRPREERTAYIVTEQEEESFFLFLKKNGYEAYVKEECKIGKFRIFSAPYNFSSL